MKCASYTRTLSNEPGSDSAGMTIGEQNASIETFLRSRRWSLRGKYSDRPSNKDAVDGFIEMKAGACRREFECLIVQSAYRLGNDYFKSLRYLQESLYPAGIHFAVVEDDFASSDHTAEEVATYLEEKRSEYYGKDIKKKMGHSSVESYFSAYGLRYIKEENRVVIDEESAAVVREIYERLKAGEKPGRIAEDLTERGAENPNDYFCRQRGWPIRNDRSREWNSKSIKTISTNPRYAGRWECDYDPDTLTIDCGAIVDPELFDEVQKVRQSRYHQKPTKCNPCPFAKRIFDKSSGLPLRYFNNSKKGIPDIRFDYPKDKSVASVRKHMVYTDFEDQASSLLRTEKSMAAAAADYVSSDHCKSYLERLLEQEREHLPVLLASMGRYENRKALAYARLVDGEISESEYLVIESECKWLLALCDKEAERIAARAFELQTAYSADNPWIKLFSTYDEDAELSRDYIAAFVERFDVVDFVKVELIPQESMWKKMISPGEMEADYGTNQ